MIDRSTQRESSAAYKSSEQIGYQDNPTDPENNTNEQVLGRVPDPVFGNESRAEVSAGRHAALLAVGAQFAGATSAHHSGCMLESQSSVVGNPNPAQAENIPNCLETGLLKGCSVS